MQTNQFQTQKTFEKEERKSTNWTKAKPLDLPVAGSLCKSTTSTGPKGWKTCLISDSVSAKLRDPTYNLHHAKKKQQQHQFLILIVREEAMREGAAYTQ